MVQTDAQRIANLEKLVSSAPKPCGISDVDGYAAAARNAALMVITNSKKLEEFNKAFEEGNKPSLEEVESLAETIEREKDAVQAATEKAKGAVKAIEDEGEKVKSGSMKEKLEGGKRLKNANKVVNFANDATAMVTAESAAQALAVSNMLAKVKK